jgi:sugar lactone lactonase YvrE
MKRFLRRLIALTLILLIGLVGLIKLRYGGGADFPDRSTPAVLPPSALEVVAELPTPPGNIAVAADGRVFISLHPEAHPEVKVAELVDGVAVAFPDAAFQNDPQEARRFRNVLGVRIDHQNRLWTLDNGNHGIDPPRLLAFDITSRAVVHEFVFPREIAGLGSHLNDFQVSADGSKIFIADASIFGKHPGLVIYDVATRRARRLLDGHPSVTADNYTPVVQGRRMEIFGIFAIRPGVDSIALDAKGEWLYFAPVSSLSLYRARTADLLDEKLSAADLAGKVEVYAPKTMSDGITIGSDDTLYLTDPEHSAIERINPDRSLQTLVRSDPLLRWPDGFSFGPDGWLYISCSSLQDVIGRAPAHIAARGPYQVLRIKIENPGEPGH